MTVTIHFLSSEVTSVHLWPNSLYCAARLQTSNGFFCFISHLSGGRINVGHNATHSPSLAGKNKTENDSRLFKSIIAKEIAVMNGFFCQGQEADIALFLQHRNKQSGLKCTNHK